MSKKDLMVAVAIVLCAVGLVACGGGSDDSGGGASASFDDAAAEEGRLEMAECMREHGIDMPDPEPGQGMMMKKAGPDDGVNLDDPAAQEALEACEEEVDFKPPELTAGEQEQMQEDMLAFAQCMREQGVEMPDPEVDGGKVTMRIGGPDGPELDEPAMEAAQEACESKMPGGGFKAGP